MHARLVFFLFIHCNERNPKLFEEMGYNVYFPGDKPFCSPTHMAFKTYQMPLCRVIILRYSRKQFFSKEAFQQGLVFSLSNHFLYSRIMWLPSVNYVGYLSPNTIFIDLRKYVYNYWYSSNWEKFPKVKDSRESE